MTFFRDPLAAGVRSLPLAVLLSVVLSAVILPFIHWAALMIFGDPASPPLAVWVDYIAVRAVAGACLGCALYAIARLPAGWLRMCLYWTLFSVMIDGEVEDFARWSLPYWLLIWLSVGLSVGLLMGSVFHWIESSRRAGSRAEA